MGGMHGFGPVKREEDEPVFHEPWEGRLFAMQMSGMVPLFASGDAGRFALEQLDPAEYVNTPYYERWLARMENRLVELGILTREELDDRIRYYRQHPHAEVPRRQDPAVAGQVMERVRNRLPPPRDSGTPPRFRVGEAIRTRNDHPQGAPPAAAIRARASRYRRPSPRLSRSGRRPGPGRPQPRGALQREFRRGRALGRLGRGQGQRVHRPVGQLSRTRGSTGGIG